MADKAQEEKTVVNRRVSYFMAPFHANFGEDVPMVFEKEVIRVGEWSRPGMPDEKFKVTLERMQQWVDNFDKGLLPEGVMITLGHDTWNPMSAVGVVTKLFIQGESLMARMEFMLSEVAERVNKTIRGISMGLDMEYVDPKTSVAYGEVIYHIALTNDPHIKGMAPFEEVMASRGILPLVFQYQGGYNALGLGGKESQMPGEEVKDQAQKEQDKKISDLAEQNAELKKSNIELARQNEETRAAQKEMHKNLLKAEYRTKVDGLVAKGIVLPAEKDGVLSTIFDGLEVTVKFDNKEMTLAEKIFLSFEKMAPKVDMKKRISQPAPDGGNADEPSTVEFDREKLKLVMGLTTPEKFKEFRDGWADRFARAGSYQSSAREVKLDPRLLRSNRDLSGVGISLNDEI